MIRQIVIQSIAIAENISVNFGPGLNIVTGETGAGKSILVDALALLRGGRVDLGLIRTGCESAQVSGIFALHEQSPVYALLEKHGIPLPEDEIILRRVVQKNGRHRAFINDTPVNARTLQRVAEELIDISSQFENQKLLDVQTHTEFLDRFCGTSDLAATVATLFNKTHTLLSQIRDAEKERDKRLREKDLYEFEFNEISDAALDANEFAEIEALLLLGKKTGTVTSLCQETLDVLVENETSCFSLMRYARKNIEKLVKLTEGSPRPLNAGVLQEVWTAIDNTADELRAVSRSFSVDEELLSWANDRIEIYNKLLRKFGPTVESILAHREHCSAFLLDTNNMDSQVETLCNKFAATVLELLNASQQLSRIRRASPEALSQKVQHELAELGMTKARFVCQFVPGDRRTTTQLPSRILNLLSESIINEYLSLGTNGAEETRFLLSANTGVEPQSIERVASGGELSRVMLAIKTILFAEESVNLFVFDEIDTGISGNVAAKVGRKIAQFCHNRQAICITHLPQVACHAGSHFVAKKYALNGSTTARLELLRESERAQELAGMLSGEKITSQGLAQAKALLNEARTRI